MLTNKRFPRFCSCAIFYCYVWSWTVLIQAQQPMMPAAPINQPRGEEPTFKAYDVNGDAATIAAGLQIKLPANAGISVLADTRTNRVIVGGPASAHQLVAQLLATQNVPAAAPQVVPANERLEKSLALTQLKANQFESALANMIGRKLPVSTDATGQLQTFTLTGRDNTATLLTLDLTRGQVLISGRRALVDAWEKVIVTLDKAAAPNVATPERAVPLRNADVIKSGTLEKAMQLIGQQVSDRTVVQPANRMVNMLFQPRAEQPAAPAADPAKPMGEDDGLGGALSGPVTIEYIEALDIIVIKANNQRDLEKVTKLIEEIEKQSVDSVPEITIHYLKNVGSDAMANIVRSLYDQVLSPRQGRVSITSLVKPNALLLIGRKEANAAVIDLINKLDQPVEPASQFKIFELKFAAANEVLQTVQAFLSGQTVGGTATTTGNQFQNQGIQSATITAPGLGTRAVVTADYRTNSLIVRASERDLKEIEALIQEIDKNSSGSVNELRVFNLKYSLAEEIAPVLQSALSGTQQQQRTQQQGNQQQQNPFGQQQLQNLQQQGNQQNSQQRAARSIMLQFLTVDAQGKKLLKSGLLSDVRINGDARGNSLIVSAPSESMELIAALIKELDQMPTAEAQIKVFTIKNGDAANLVTMLQGLFGGTTNQQGGNQQRGGQGNLNFGNLGGEASGENPLVGLRFSIDQRTNSIIATGSGGDLNIVEAILLRLDESDVRQRKSTVYRLKNAPSLDVANSINQLLNSERQLQQVAPQSLSPFEQIEKEVVVVPEQVSNSLIISATPRYFDEIKRIIEQLDQRPPMVMIQVLIAEVQLANNDEFGVELGVQDSVLFDRGLLGDLVTTTQTTTFGNPATTVQNQNIVAATNTPGFNFAGQPLGNSGSTQALSNSSRVGSQGISSFALGRTNSTLGFGGLVLSASSENLSVLLRALSANRRLEVLSRPQIMTLDNQPAFIQVGQRVPRITNVSVNLGIQNNSVTLENVGLILGVTPRISPDGLVVMEVDAEKSEVGPEAEGVPIFVNATGEVVRSPRFNTSVAQTTVSAANGQTIILGGLISKSKADFSRRAPFLSDIPLLGHLFRYDSTESRRNELLIILTPRIVRTQQDAELIKQVESSRMSWCLSDVVRIHGPSGLKARNDKWSQHESMVVYPDYDPRGEGIPLPNEGEAGPVPNSNNPEIDAIRQQLPPGAIINSENTIPGEKGTLNKPIPDVLPNPGSNGGAARPATPTVRAASTPVPGPTLAPPDSANKQPATPITTAAPSGVMPAMYLPPPQAPTPNAAPSAPISANQPAFYTQPIPTAPPAGSK